MKDLDDRTADSDEGFRGKLKVVAEHTTCLKPLKDPFGLNSHLV